MSSELSKLIIEIENENGIQDYYLHRNWHTGSLELNIEFDNDIADKILEDTDIKEIHSCAFWE